MPTTNVAGTLREPPARIVNTFDPDQPLGGAETEILRVLLRKVING